MGNANGREARPSHFAVNSNDPEALRSAAAREGTGNVYSSRQGRASQSNLASIFSSSSHRDREREGPQDEAALAARRETKAEREIRRAEKERNARQRERERSMREESVDGGYLVTQGVYTGAEDYNKDVVRTLMIERRIAPFWPGLDDCESHWAEHQLIAAVHKRPVPAADEAPTSTTFWPPADGPQYTDAGSGPSSPRSIIPGQSSPTQLSSSPPPASGSLLKGRAKTLASLTVPSASRGDHSPDLAQREQTIPAEPLVNGQRLEVFLYKDAAECPICLLYYPPYLNQTRCCDQPICSECFVQIKRPEPHPPEHHDDPNNPTAQAQISQEREQDPGEVTLVSEPAKCPYCGVPEMGVTFAPPPIRRGLVFANSPGGSNATSPLTSPTSPTRPMAGRKRAASLPATATTVITTDRIRPEWSNKLQTARAHAARRSAAATALHTAAYMMGGSSQRRLPLFRRGNSSRNPEPDEAGEGSSGVNDPNESRGDPLDIIALMQAAARGTPGQAQASPAGQRGSSRRNRTEDLENMMMMEAIRMSIASEEDRRRKEEKERAKEEKKKAKDEKKANKEAQKAARKANGSSSSLYGMLGASRSNLTVNSAQPSMASQDSTPGKGKGPARERSESNPYLNPSPAGSSQNPGAQAHLERSRANLQPPTDALYGSGRPTHLRSLSNASSSTSSLVDPSPNPSGLRIPGAGASREDVDSLGTTPPGGGAGLEPIVNFQSLMAMIDNEDRTSGNQAGSASTLLGQSPPEGSTSFGQDVLQSMQDIGNEAGPQNQQEPDKHIDSASAVQPGVGNTANGHDNSHVGDSKHGVEITSGQLNYSTAR